MSKQVHHITRQAINEEQNMQCLFCGKRTGLTIDHIQHRSRGGKNDRENLRGVCRSCHDLRHWAELLKWPSRLIFAIQFLKGDRHMPLIDRLCERIFMRFIKGDVPAPKKRKRKKKKKVVVLVAGENAIPIPGIDDAVPIT